MTSGLHCRRKLAIGIAVLLCADPAAASGPTNGKPELPRPSALVIASIGDGAQDQQRAALFAMFSMQTGIPIRLQSWDGSLATLQKHAASGEEDWNLALMEAPLMQQACREGLMLSEPLMTQPQADAPDSEGKNCGLAAWRMSLVLAWDKNRVDTTPNWSDFWDVARRPGKRGLRRDPRGTLEIALMADGVAPDDVYRTLATEEGLQRAFRKLDQLRPYIVWWSTLAEPVQLLESGAVLMTSAPDQEVEFADLSGRRNFGTQAAGSLGVLVQWGVPRRAASEHREQALQFLRYTAAPENRPSFDAAFPSSTPQPSIMMDQGFWDKNLTSLQQRFDIWFSSR